jgi:uncharacterized protein YdaU (DUF1376 family)
MSLHIGDYLKDTRHLRAPLHGAYLLLIMHYWTKGGLPDDDCQLSAIACMADREWKKARPTIEAFFAPGWRHKRIDQEIADATERYEKRVAAGRKGGVAKAQHSSSNARPELPAKPKQPLTLTPSSDEEGGGGDARGGSLISPAAHDLAGRLLDAWGIDRDDPRAPGTSYTAQKWLTAGWNGDLCVTTIRATVAGRDPPGTLKYFEKAIARAHAEQAAPVPVAVISQTPEVVHGNHQSAGSVVDAARRLAGAGVTFGERPSVLSRAREHPDGQLPEGPGVGPGDVRRLDSGGAERVPGKRGDGRH